MTKHKMHGKLMCAHPMHVHILFPMTSLDVDAKPSTPVSPSSTRARVPSVVRDLNWSPATSLLLVVLAGALFLDGLDISMVGVALPSIGSDPHLVGSALQMFCLR